MIQLCIDVSSLNHWCKKKQEELLLLQYSEEHLNKLKSLQHLYKPSNN